MPLHTIPAAMDAFIGFAPVSLKSLWHLGTHFGRDSEGGTKILQGLRGPHFYGHFSRKVQPPPNKKF